MKTVVDTSVVLALLYPDDVHNERAGDLLHEASEAGKTVLNPVVYSELAADSTFDSRDELDYFLSDTGLVMEPVTAAISYRAGESFRTYLDRRGDHLECPSCGRETAFDCPSCGTTISARQHIAADFLIGAHAETADRLLTFDAGFFRNYFDVSVQTVMD